MCYVLVGYNTTFEQDQERVAKLWERKVKPHIMVYNQKDDRKLKDFARFVYAGLFKKQSFADYKPRKEQ